MAGRTLAVQRNDVNGDEPTVGAVGRCPFDRTGGGGLPAYPHYGLILAAPAGAAKEGNHSHLP